MVFSPLFNSTFTGGRMKQKDQNTLWTERRTPLSCTSSATTPGTQDLTQQKNKSDGLAVLGVFIEVGGETNQAFSFLTEYATKLANSSSSLSNIRPFGLAPMLPWTTLHKYFRYHGSLTIPGCQESVTWTLFKESVKISSAQMKSLRNLTNASGKQLVNNYRPVQPLNKRTVKNSFLPPSCSVIRSTSIIIDINAGLFSLMLLSALFGH